MEHLLYCDLVASACDDEGLPGCVLGPAILEVHSAAWLQLLRGRGRWCSLCFPFLPPLPEPLVLDGQVGTCVGVPAEVHLAGCVAMAADPAVQAGDCLAQDACCDLSALWREATQLSLKLLDHFIHGRIGILVPMISEVKVDAIVSQLWVRSVSQGAESFGPVRSHLNPGGVSDWGDDRQKGLHHVLPVLAGGEAGCDIVGKSVAVDKNQLRSSAHDIGVHVAAWMQWTWAGGKGVKLPGKSSQGCAERAVSCYCLASAFDPEGNEVPVKGALELSGEWVAEPDVHDGQDGLQQQGRHIHSGDLPHGNRVKVLRDYETPVHLAGLEELVEDSPVLVLVTGHLALLLAGNEPDAVGAVSLEVDPRLTAAERNGSRPRAHYLSQVGCESSQGGRINGGEGDGGQRDRHEGNLLGDVVQKPLDLAILAAA